MRGLGRWRTLGGLIILIAALAVPLSIHARHRREAAARQALIDNLERAVDAQLDALLNTIESPDADRSSVPSSCLQ